MEQQFNPDYAGLCPTANCGTTTPLIEAFATLQSGNCTANCSATACGTAYKTVRGYHDQCEMSNSDAEKFHTYEDTCEDASQGCNFKDSKFDPNVCTSDATLATATLFPLVLAMFATWVAAA